ncbi:hypothetical protein [Pedobacter sp. SG918]|uniref:hypothetical protein n=2 Tax=unclassified Pedobacter TaxID=2628915 RepID=UPI00146F4C93|nr:hypothetical protein [Pedobacter sp. SG918]NII81044.1 RsiW-degrading membrane proteinase PrsW (M82 family) [Pedobacter sp. SG908]NMN35062.1 RsiW-degrading membrane proteinase PrsW (M82 family) [Pedobacter sp. SG918]
MLMKDHKDHLSRFWFIVSNALPPIGFFLYFRHRKAYPNKAKSALTSAMIGMPLALLGGYIMNTFILD